jgi:peptidoglycan/xylan/chitin deacetylase (PgdA/CDA1 family)/glycosyltransferase involved in cell wall biosynthesis
LTGEPPALSVLIATHNRRELLGRCLRALEAQTQDPRSFEVIVADDGSSDGTAEELERRQTPLALRVLKLEKAGKPAVLNAAIEAARGGVCLFLDDDIIVSPGLVTEHLAAHQREPKALGIGKLIQRAPANSDPYAEANARQWNGRYKGLPQGPLDWADCYGANFSAPRDALREIGGFAGDLAAVEDLEVAYRLSGVGCLPRYLPQAEAVHDDDKPGSRILADEERFGAFCAKFVAQRPRTRQRLLGWVNEPTVREVLLRRLLLALRVPARGLVGAGHLIPPARRDVWFGFVSRYAFWRGVRSGMDRSQWQQTTRGVPVLMYHAFTDSGEVDRFIVSKSSLTRQLQLLAALRYKVLPLEQLGQALRDGRPLPKRAVAITIDDGYADNFEVAYPVLSRRRLAATIFLVSERIGAGNDWDDEGAIAGRPLLSSEQIARMRTGGIEFGAHTRTHRALPDLSDAELEEQVRGSREDLEAVLGEQVEVLAYPYGRHDARVVKVAAAAGLTTACTTRTQAARPGDDPLAIPRIEIDGDDGLARFLRKLWLGGR